MSKDAFEQASWRLIKIQTSSAQHLLSIQMAEVQRKKLANDRLDIGWHRFQLVLNVRPSRFNYKNLLIAGKISVTSLPLQLQSPSRSTPKLQSSFLKFGRRRQLDRGFSAKQVARDFIMVDGKVATALIVGAPLEVLMLVILVVVGCTWACRCLKRSGYEPIEDSCPQMEPRIDRESPISVAGLIYL